MPVEYQPSERTSMPLTFSIRAQDSHVGRQATLSQEQRSWFRLTLAERVSKEFAHLADELGQPVGFVCTDSHQDNLVEVLYKTNRAAEAIAMGEIRNYVLDNWAGLEAEAEAYKPESPSLQSWFQTLLPLVEAGAAGLTLQVRLDRLGGKPGWGDMAPNSPLRQDCEYRIKPRLLNGFEVPQPIRSIHVAVGSFPLYVADPTALKLYSRIDRFDANSKVHTTKLERGLLHTTPEAATAQALAMMGYDPGNHKATWQEGEGKS